MCATPLELRMLFGKQRPTCPACGWIHFTDPKVAAAALVEKDGKVLLTRRVNEPYQGLWTLPAGFVDAFEDPARAAEREVFEETGLLVRTIQLLDVISGREHTRGSDIFIVYRACIEGGDLHPGDDADQVAFFSYNTLPRLAFKTTQKILSDFRKE
jgi:8-oxo-dGTP diphosphatase